MLSILNLLKLGHTNPRDLNKNLLLLFLLFSLCFSCKKENKSFDGTTFISGMIVNPKMDYVIISQGNNVLDTIQLDSKNFFVYKTDKIMDEGLYTFRHNETQVFFVEPGDSLVLHLNTMDFDESLNYSGRGAAKNNLLMTLFLANEKENANLHRWYTLPPEEFVDKIDSLRKRKEAEYRDFLSRNQVSPKFKEMVSTSINYDYYSKKELYGTANKKRLGELDSDFYNHRKNIDFGNEDLRLYYPYYRFLIRFFDNLMVSKHAFGIDRNSFEFSRDKLYAIDSLATSDSLRNSLTRFTATRYFFRAKQEEEQKEFLNEFKKFNNNPQHIQEIEELAANSIKMSQGKNIPNISLLSMENVVVNLHDVIKKPTVFYFWSFNSMEQGRVIHNRASELKSKYPEYDFIGINTDDHFRRWRSHVQREKYDVQKEYQLDDVQEAEKILVLTKLDKAIVVDKNGTILDGNTNMFNADFEEKLLGYLNR